MANEVISYADIDFNSLQADIISYITQQSEFTDQNRQGSNFQLLTKILAYVTTLLSYNLNQGVNETYLDSAQLRSNVLKIIKILNYVPARKQSAKVYADLSAIVASPNFLKQYDSIIGADKTFYYVGEDFDLGVATSKSNVLFTEGTFVQNLTAYTGNGTEFQSFIIEDTNIGQYFRWFAYDTNTQVKTYWTEFDPTAVYTEPQIAEIFFIEEIEQGYKISCGNNKQGLIFANNTNFGYEYLQPSDAADANEIATFEWNAGTFITEATVGLNAVNDASYSAEPKETIANIKYNAPKFFQTQGREVVESDYYAFAIKHPWIENADVIGGEKIIPEQLGKVFITVKADPIAVGNIYFSESELSTLRDYFKTYNVVTINPIVRNPQFVYLILSSILRYTTVQQPSKTLVGSAVDTYVNTSNAKFGDYLEFSKLQAVVDTADSLITSSLLTLVKYVWITSDNYTDIDGNGNKYETNTYTITLSKKVDIAYTTRIVELSSGGTILNTYTQDVDYGITYLDGTGLSGYCQVVFYETGFTLGIDQTGNDNEYRLYFETVDQDIFLNSGQIFTIKKQEVIDNATLEKV